MQIATMTGQSEITGIIGAAVLFCHNMFNVIDHFAMFLVQPAVFATLASPKPYEVPTVVRNRPGGLAAERSQIRQCGNQHQPKATPSASLERPRCLPRQRRQPHSRLCELLSRQVRTEPAAR
jgi:hypothetical protein